MGRLFARVFGVPHGVAGREAAFAALIGRRSPEETQELLRNSATHNTEKSGALLAAQGIFVVDIFAIDNGWPRTIVLTSLVLLVTASLVVMTNLRSTLGAYLNTQAAPARDPTSHIFAMIMSRTIRFNVALYLTFLAIILLGAVAVLSVF